MWLNGGGVGDAREINVVLLGTVQSGRAARQTSYRTLSVTEQDKLGTYTYNVESS